MKTPQIKLVSRNRRWNADLMIHERHRFDPRGSLMISLAERLLITAVIEGHHESGRPLYRNLTDEEAVDRAEMLVDRLYAKLEDRGWILDVPDLEDMEKFESNEPGPGFTNGEHK